MSKCKKIKESIVEAIYNQLPEANTLDFNQHIKSCTQCMEEYLKIKSLLEFMDKRQRPKMSDQFWDNFSLQMEDKINKQANTYANEMKADKAPKARKPFWSRAPWLLYPATALAILVLGIGIGRYMSQNPSQTFVDATISSIQRISPKVAEHFDNIRPLLIDYANYSTPAENEAYIGGTSGSVMVDKEIIRQLLLENQLLKQMVTRENNISVKELLEELELVLLELSNSNGNKDETNKTVQQIINENDLLFKIKVLKKREKKELTL
jgi:hypothetical protein